MQRVWISSVAGFALLVLAAAIVVAVVKDTGPDRDPRAAAYPEVSFGDTIVSVSNTPLPSGSMPFEPTSTGTGTDAATGSTSSKGGGAPGSTSSSRTAGTPSSSGSDSSSSSTGSDPVVAFLGDDWTAGAGASSKSKRFTSLLSARLNLTERNFGERGSAYAGPDSYSDRLDAVAAADPDVVVVAGGRNNVAANQGAAAIAAAATFFATLHDRLPDVEIIAIAPMWGDSAAPPSVLGLRDTVRTAVRAVGGTYLSIADPLDGHPEYMADDANPDDDGYRAIADAVAPKLEKALTTG